MKLKLHCFLSILLTILLLIWLGSPTSLRWYAYMIESFSDGMVRIDNLQGHPLWELHADKITVQDIDMIVSIHQPRLHWQAWQIFLGHVHIDHAEISLVDIKMLAIETPTTFALSDLNFLQFFEADELSLKQLTYRDGSTTLTWHDLNASDISLGRTISGHLFGRYNERYLQVHLAGGYQQWQAELYVLYQQDTELLLQLRGFAWDQGQLNIQGKYAFKLEGHWSHQGDEWLLKAKTSTSKQKKHAECAWTLHANPVINHYRLDAHGILYADWLQEHGWEFQLSSLWNDTDHWLRLTDQKHTENWLKMDYKASDLQLKVHTKQWDIPLKQAYGWLSSDTLVLWNMKKNEWQASFHVHDSQLASLPLQLQGEVSGQQLNWQIKNLSATMLGLKLDILGQQKAEALNLQIQGDAPHLKDILALANMNADASLQANIEVKGHIMQPLFSWDIKLNNLKNQDMTIKQLDFSGQADPVAWLADMKLTTKKIQLGQHLNWQDLAVQFKKTGKKVSVSSQGNGDMGWRLAIEGTQDQHNWQGKLEKLLLQYQGQDILHLKPTTWSWKQGVLHVAQSQLLLHQQQGTWQFQADTLGPNLQINLASLNLAAISQWLPNGTLSGKPTAFHASLQGHWDQPILSLKTNSQQWLFHDQKTALKLKLNIPMLQLNYHNGAWRWQGQTALHTHESFDFKGQIPWQLSLYPWRNAPNANAGVDHTQLNVQLHDLNAWQSLVFPNQDIHLNGDVYTDIQVSDVLGQAKVQGNIMAHLKQLQIPALGVDLQAKLQASWQETHGDLNLSLNTDQGEARLHGALLWPLQRSTLSLQLSDFPMIQSDDNHVTADGQLTLKADKNNHVLIAGSIAAQKMLLSFPETLPQAPEDIVWDDEEREQDHANSTLEMGHLNIKITLAKDAKIIGEGMQMDLKGVLHVGGTLAHPTLTGDVLVHGGFFTFRHIALQVQPDSHIIFTGNMSQPSLNIRVAKQHKEMLLGVHISGSTDDIQSVFYSDPAMTQTEILAYMATGKSLGNMDGNDLSVAANVASFFLSSDSNVLTKVHDVLQRSFGLDSLNWEITPNGGRVVAGKRLNNRMNVQLEQSLQAGASTALTLEYMLVRGLAVFARQISNKAPVFGLRYRKVWDINPTQPNPTP